MNEIREIFRKFGPQVLHIIIVPAFFLCFMLIYTPFDLDNYLVSPKHGYAFHITILTCIYFGCEIITRSIMFAVRRKLNTNLYVALCFGFFYGLVCMAEQADDCTLFQYCRKFICLIGIDFSLSLHCHLSGVGGLS